MNSSAGKPWFSRAHRIGIGWKAQRLRLSSPEAQEVDDIFWTVEHFKPLFLTVCDRKAAGGARHEARGSHLQALRWEQDTERKRRPSNDRVRGNKTER
jgi:hypothetical protein